MHEQNQNLPELAAFTCQCYGKNTAVQKLAVNGVNLAEPILLIAQAN